MPYGRAFLIGFGAVIVAKILAAAVAKWLGLSL